MLRIDLKIFFWRIRENNNNLKIFQGFHKIFYNNKDFNIKI